MANLAVQPGHEKLDVTWEARSSGGVPTGYDVHYTAAGSSALGLNADLGTNVATQWVEASHSGTTTSASITGLTNGTEYRVRVRGTNSDGNGGYQEVKGTPQPTITLTSSDADGVITEGDAAVTLTATLSAAAGSSGVTVSVARAAGSTVEAGDFTFSSASITISSGNTTGTTTLTIEDDQEDEDDETLILRASAAGHVEAGGISERLSLTIRDNDTARVDVSESARTVEVGETTTYAVKLDTKPTASVTIQATSDGTDKATVSPATRTFSTTNWNTAQEFTITGKAVGTPDIDHTVSSSTDPKYPTSMAIDDVDVTVNASTKTYRITATKTVAEADSASAALTVTLGRAPTDSAGLTLSVSYDYSGSAATTADTGTTPTSITVAQNATTATLTVPIANDALVEDDETFTVTIRTSASGWNPATTGANVATITITDDEAANAKIAFHASNAAATTAYTDSEDEDVSGGTLTVPVTVSALPQSNTTFDVEVVSSGTTATENTDYRIGTKSVTFGSSGSKTRNVSISLTNDALVENDETIKLKIKENPTRQMVSNINVGSTHNFLLASSNIRQGFRVGAGSSGFTLTSIEAKLVDAANAAQAATFRAELWSDASNRPSSKLADLRVPATWSANSTVSLAAPSSVVLSANTTYHLVLYTVGGYDPKVPVTTNNGEDSGGLAGWSVANEGSWQASDQPTAGGAAYDKIVNIRVNGFAGRPSDLGYHYARNASGSTAALLIEDDDADAAKIAFGTDAAGAVKYTRSHNETASATVRVTVSHLPAESTAFTVETVTSGADAGTATEYVDSSNRGDFRIADKTVTFGSTGAKHRDVPITLYDDSLVENDQTIELRLKASLTTPAAPATLVSNHKQTTGTSFSSNNWVSAQAFTTGSNPAGYKLTAIEAVVEQTWVNNPQRRSVRAELWSRQASSGNPDQKIEDLTAPMDFANTLSFAAPSNTVLTANTIYYFLLYTTGNYNMAIDRVTSPNEDNGAAVGWSITDGRRAKNAQTPDGAAAWTGEANSMRITVKGSVPLGDLYTRHAEGSKGTVTIEDDEARAAKVAFNSSAAATAKFTATPAENVSGGKQTVPITVSALPEVESDFTVSVLAASTATEDADYTIAAKTFTFAPTDDATTPDVDETALTRNLEITITDDMLVEDDQTIELEISSGDGFFDKYARHANASKATVTIHDDEHHDAKIAIGAVATSTTKHTASAAEGTDATLTVPITINHLPESDTTFAVEVLTSGTTARDSDDATNATGNPKDYEFVAKEVTFGSTSAKSMDLTINVADDNVEEDDEQIQLRIKPADNPNDDLGDYYARDAAGSTATITLASDDAVSGVTLKIQATPSTSSPDLFDVFEGSSLTLTATADIPVGPGGWLVTTQRHSSDQYDPMQPNLCNSSFMACPNDFTLPGPFTIREGQTEATGTLVIARDNRNEATPEWLHLYATAERRGVSYDTDPPLKLRLKESSNGINLNQVTLNLVEGESATYTVSLRGSAAPTDSVTVTPTSSAADKATVSAALTFTGGASSNWQDPQEITVTAVAAGAVTITHAATSDDPKFSLSSSALGSLQATVSEPENTYRISQGARVAEGETAELTVTLGALAPSTDNPEFALDRTRTHNREFLVGDQFTGPKDAGLADVSSDLSTPPDTLTVTADERRATLTETIADDDLVEGDEHYYVMISTAQSGWSEATGSRPGHGPHFKDCFHIDTCARVTITDPDAAEAKIAFGNAADATTAYAASVDEGAGTLTVPVTITALPQSSTTFNIEVVTSGATATEGTDYSIATKSVTFHSDADADPPTDTVTTKNVTVTITGDTDAEGDETFQLRIAAADATVNDLGDHYDRNPNSSRATLTITDDDGAATVSTTAFTVKPSASDTYTIALAGATPASDVTITPASTAADKATVSCAADPCVLTFTPTNYRQPQTVTVNGIAEGTSHINHLISGGGPAYSASSTPVAAVTVTVAAVPTATLSVAPDPVDEGGSVTVTLELSEAVGEVKTIPISLGDTADTAETGDYGTLANIPITATGTRFTGQIATNHDMDADDETFTVALGTLPPSVGAGSATSQTVTITDDDDPIEAISSLTVEEGNAELRVKWSKPDGDHIEDYQVHYTSADAGTVADDADVSADPADDATTAWMDSGHTGAGTSITITGLVNEEDESAIVYRIRARAVNSEQEDTDWSPIGTGTPGASKRLPSPRPPGPGPAPAPLSGDATLSGITLTAGGQPVALTETFAADTTTYTASVDYSTDMITVSARTRRADAVMVIAPEDADSETDGLQVSLDVGENRVTITVTAEDGTTRAYALTVTRAEPPAGDSALIDVTLTAGDEAMSLDETFDADTMTYTASVAHSTDMITVSARTRRADAVMVIAPEDADSETDGHQVSLDVGENRVTITVTAEDGTTRAYALTVTRAEPPAGDSALIDVTLTAGDEAMSLDETFDADTMTYTASVAHSTDMITVSARTRRADAVMVIAPEDADAEAAGHQVRLAMGRNDVTITVTVPEESPLVYTLAVTRAAAPTPATPGGVPPVTNLAVREGPNPGEAVLSWDAVASATHYRIGYVNMEVDYHLAKAGCTAEWIGAFIFVDVNARNIPVNFGRAEYTVQRLSPGARHAFTVLTADRFVDTGHQGSVSSEFYWPSNPRWKFLPGRNALPTGVTLPTGECSAAATPATGPIPPVTNLAVRVGANAGEAVLSWDAVASATHYRIGYVNMEVDYHLAKASCTGEWIQAYIFVDVNARNIPVSAGRAEYTVRRLSPGARHAFTVLTADRFVDTGHQGSVSSEFYWPSNPRWKFLPGRSDLPSGITLPNGECSVPSGER